MIPKYKKHEFFDLLKEEGYVRGQGGKLESEKIDKLINLIVYPYSRVNDFAYHSQLGVWANEYLGIF